MSEICAETAEPTPPAVGEVSAGRTGMIASQPIPDGLPIGLVLVPLRAAGMKASALQEDYAEILAVLAESGGGLPGRSPPSRISIGRKSSRCGEAETPGGAWLAGTGAFWGVHDRRIMLVRWVIHCLVRARRRDISMIVDQIIRASWCSGSRSQSRTRRRRREIQAGPVDRRHALHDPIMHQATDIHARCLDTSNAPAGSPAQWSPGHRAARAPNFPTAPAVGIETRRHPHRSACRREQVARHSDRRHIRQ